MGKKTSCVFQSIFISVEQEARGCTQGVSIPQSFPSTWSVQFGITVDHVEAHRCNIGQRYNMQITHELQSSYCTKMSPSPCFRLEKLHQEGERERSCLQLSLKQLLQVLHSEMCLNPSCTLMAIQGRQMVIGRK